jgi:hypothetical protein
MRCIILLLCLLPFVATAADSDADLYKQVQAENATIKPTYDKIRSASSPHYQSFKEKIDAGEKDVRAIEDYYLEVTAELLQLQKFRKRVDAWNDYANASNAVTASKQDKAASAAERKAQLADLNARKSFTTTELNTKDRSGWVVNADGSLSFISGTETGVSTKVTREDPAVASRRAKLEKEEIAAKSRDEQTQLELQKLAAIDCEIQMAQIDALLANEKKKRKYLLELTGKQRPEAATVPAKKEPEPVAAVDAGDVKRQWEEKWKSAPVYKLTDGTEIRAQRDNDLGETYLVQDFEGKWHSVKKSEVKEVARP